jgi:heat shock protein HslJ
MKRAWSCIAIAALMLLGAAAPASAQMRHKEDEDAPKPLPPLQKNFPLGQTWSLRELNGKPVPATLDVSFKIDGALHGSGFAGCNSWSAVIYPIKDQHLAVGQYALTKKKCDKDTTAIEVGFLTALLGSPAWDLVNGDLVIKGPRGALRLVRSL